VEAEKTGIVGTNISTVAGVAIGGALLAAGAHAVRRTVMKRPEDEADSAEKSTPRKIGGEK
jgi:F420-nonreducing hydrogenase I